MKIYTKKGDTGCSQLAPGKTISKTSAIFDLYGHLDELNSFLGFVACSVLDSSNFKPLILRIQQELLDIGGSLSNIIAEQGMSIGEFNNWLQPKVKVLEEEIDEWQNALPPMQGFVLPGGNEVSARFHLARVVCRRSERVFHCAQQENKLPEELSVYINRLSDWLYVAALYSSKTSSAKPII